MNNLNGSSAKITKNIKHGFAQFVGSGPFDQPKEEGEEELKKRPLAKWPFREADQRNIYSLILFNQVVNLPL